MKIEKQTTGYVARDDDGNIIGIGREFTVLLDGVDVTWKCHGANDGADGSEPFVETLVVKGGDPDVKPLNNNALHFEIKDGKAVTRRRTGKVGIDRIQTALTVTC